MKIIHEKINSYSFLTEDDKAYLIKWSNPKNPPSRSEFRLWANSLKNASKDFSIQRKKSLLQLGSEIAVSNKLIINDKDEAEINDAINDLKETLGLSTESEQLLLNKIFPEETHETDEKIEIDVNEIKKLLDGDYEEIKDKVRTLLRDPLFSIETEIDKDTHRINILQQVKALADQGMSAYAFPTEYGGLQEGGKHIAVFEMLGYGDLSLAIKFGVQIGLFGGAVYMLGTEKHHRKYVEDLHKCDLLGCFAMTETGHGSNVKNLETTATYDHATKEIIVNSPNFKSGKEYIGNALHSHMAAVFAQLIVDGESHGVHAVLVPIRDNDKNLLPNIKVEDCGHKMGLNGVDNGRLWFDNVRVPVDNLLDKYGSVTEDGKYASPIQNESKRFFTMLGALVVGRICVGLLGNNASKTALTIATKYAYKRRQFPPKKGMAETLIIDYPTHQKRLFPALAKTYAYHFALRDLADKYTNATEEETREIETIAAGLKSKATWHATHTIQMCREACGGKGFLSENRLAQLKGDTDIFTTFEGDNTVLMQLVAKGLLTEFKQSFHNDGYKAVVRYVLTKVKHDAYELNPVFGRNTDVEHLLDPKFHFHAFNYRKRKVLLTLSERMQKYLKRGIDPFQAFLKVQNHMMDLGDAYVDQLTLNSFYNNVNKLKDSPTKKLMTSLVQLYALQTIEDNKGWYLESDYMVGAKTKAIRRMIAKLYQNIKPHALSLIDGFAIPDELLTAPIALKEES
jgi:acyl-CoA oxidase